ncbi:MAG: carotenoid oxygenase family protein [Microthrixaceae bacterium]|nr:carotenoid oxygenase family protein [Microthrixaceae bacterium]
MTGTQGITGSGATYTSGMFAPVTEEVTAFDLEVEGALPEELTGRYLRNGPNPIEPVDADKHHWFLGDGMIHGIRLDSGRAAWYRNRYVGSTHVSEVRSQPDLDGPNWNSSPIGPNTAVGGWAGSTWAMIEAGACPVELDYELESIARNDFGGTITGAFSAHPKYDPVTRELHAVAYALPEWMDRVAYIVIGADGTAVKELPVPIEGMPMIHDMSLTRSWALVYDQPVTVDIELALTGMFPFRWNPDHGCRVGLLPREGTPEQIRWIELPLGYAFHPLNAYDTADGRVVVDIVNYDRIFDRDVQGPFGDNGQGRLERWELDPERATASISVVDERSNEFPRCNEAFSTLEHRFGWCTSVSDSEGDAWPTIKHDLRTGRRWEFDHGPGRAAGEAVFVPREGATAEDDGWLMTFVHDLGEQSTDFVVMDAADFERGDYVARVRLPQRVPFGFHGNWVPDSSVPPPG